MTNNDIFLESILDTATINRLNDHGLTVNVDKTLAEISTKAGDMDDDGIAAVFTDNSYYAHQAEILSMSVAEVVETDFLNNHNVRVEFTDEDLLHRPVYDTAEGGYSYTVTEGINTCDFNTCGYVMMRRSVFMRKFGVTEMDADALSKLDGIFNKWLRKASALATSGQITYSVSGYLPFAGRYHTRNVHSANLKELVADNTNQLISELVGKIDKLPMLINFEIDKSLLRAGINPLGYINKNLKNQFGIKMLFGSSHQVGSTISVRSTEFDFNSIKEYKKGSKALSSHDFIKSWADEVEAINLAKPSPIEIDRELLILKFICFAKDNSQLYWRIDSPLNESIYLALLKLLTKHMHGIRVINVEDKYDMDLYMNDPQDFPF